MGIPKSAELFKLPTELINVVQGNLMSQRQNGLTFYTIVVTMCTTCRSVTGHFLKGISLQVFRFPFSFQNNTNHHSKKEEMTILLDVTLRILKNMLPPSSRLQSDEQAKIFPPVSLNFSFVTGEETNDFVDFRSFE